MEAVVLTALAVLGVINMFLLAAVLIAATIFIYLKIQLTLRFEIPDTKTTIEMPQDKEMPKMKVQEEMIYDAKADNYGRYDR